MSALSFYSTVGFGVVQIVVLFVLGVDSAHDQFQEGIEVKFEEFNNPEFVEVWEIPLLEHGEDRFLPPWIRESVAKRELN